MKAEILLIGGGGHCRSCMDVIEQEGRFHIAGIVERSDVEEKNRILGYSILGSDDDLPVLRRKYDHALVTVGQIDSPHTRIRLFEYLLRLGYELPVIVSPLAYISPHANIGRGTIVMHNALVNAGAWVGQNCILNTKALIEHDVRIDDHCHVAPGAVLAGGSCLGRGVFFGCNAMSKEYVSIGSESLVGGGVSVLRNLPQRSRVKAPAPR